MSSAMLTPQALKTYEFDPAHTVATFHVKHLMIATVRGRIPIVGGHVRGDPARPHEAEIVADLDPAAIDTGTRDRDAHLRSADFLDVENHPTMRFRSTRIEPRGDDGFRVEGELTLRGVTKPVVLDVERRGEARDPWGQTHVALVARTTIDRTDWGLTWNAALEAGGWLVGDKVKVEIDVQLVERA